jgi:hypothetical protein
MAWQKASGYNLRAKVEAAIGRYNARLVMPFDLVLTRSRQPSPPSLPQP